MESWIGRPMRFEFREFQMDFAAEDFLLSFSQPNYAFHAATAYDIFRMKGVPLGKRDFLGGESLISLSYGGGETVRFVVTNTGQLVHEFNLGTPQMHAQHQAEMQMMVQFVGAELRRQNVGTEFFQTGMGKMFYDSTMPQLVKEAAALLEDAALLERLREAAGVRTTNQEPRTQRT